MTAPVSTPMPPPPTLDRAWIAAHIPHDGVLYVPVSSIEDSLTVPTCRERWVARNSTRTMRCLRTGPDR